ncbi:MAG: sigma-70 family RNA polymerase sigma factor [Planctomycetaceae bacterium]|jgi:RNA polymerase sigma factor (sigma-70 family)|nr:sigma-70 family RNA polymerase sigma factor [Planctomycetaceae bacterium]
MTKPLSLKFTLSDKTMNFHLSRIPRTFFRPFFERDDLRQEIFIALIRRSEEYDPTRSSRKTFENHLVQKAIANFIKRQRLRKNQPTESLDDVKFSKIPSCNETHCGEFNMIEQTIFATELQKIIDAMPDRLRECCERLKHYSPSETAEAMKRSAHCFQNDLKKIRRILSGYMPEIFET